MKIGYKLKKKPHPESGGGREGWFQAVLFIHLVVLILCLQVHPTSWSRTFTEFVLTAYDLLCHCPNWYFLGEFCFFSIDSKGNSSAVNSSDGLIFEKRRAKDRHFCFCKKGTGISVRCEDLLKGNGTSGGAARVPWCERELLIGQNHILFYFIFSCLFKIQNIYYQRSIKDLILGF